MSVFTPVSHAELEQFLATYQVGELLGHQGIEAGVENTNFFVDTSQGQYVLTLFEQHEASELGYFLQLTEFLADAGIPSARPIHGRSGVLLSTLNGRPAALAMRLPGSTITRPTPAQCQQIGSVLGRLHRVGKAFPLHRAADRDHGWRMRTAQTLLPHLGAEDAHLLRTEMHQQQAIPFAQLPGGTIHADLFCDNALFVGDQLSGLIDWYYACTDSWLYDLAVVANDWCCNRDGSLNPDHLCICLEAYRQERPLGALEGQHWQGMLQAAALRFWLSRLQALVFPRAGSMVLQKDPQEFRQKLQHRRTETGLISATWPGAV